MMGGHRVSIIKGKIPKNIRTLDLEEEGRALFAVLEANDKVPSAYEGRALNDVINEAVTRLQRPLGKSSAKELAQHLGDLLLEKRRKEIGFLLYAGVSIHDNVEVCTAGDIRVHLIDNDKVLAVTRDHTAVSDDESGEYEALHAPHAFLQKVATRALPSSERRPVECLTWKISTGVTLLICSSHVHQHRHPDAYVSEVLRAPQDVREGFVATILIR